MPLRFKRRLFDHLKHSNYAPSTIDGLAHDLGVQPEDKKTLQRAVDLLVKEGSLELDKSNRIVLAGMPDEITGIYRANARGFGFVSTETPYRGGDLFIPPRDQLDALNGDTVVCAVIRRRRRGEEDVVGQVIEILSRRSSTFTGELKKQGSQWLVFPDGKQLTTPIIVKDPGAKDAHEGDKVAVELVQFPEGDVLAEGVITRVLGEAGLPSVETQAIIETYNLPAEFPPACVEEARRATQQYDRDLEEGNKNGFGDRLDHRDRFIITIDPPDARDYDDAIYIAQTDEFGGGWELGVYIADVTHFVKAGSALDEEAKIRCNSTYLPRKVIPMLPELISNGICSLSEGVDRFCKAAFMVYGRDGRIHKSGVGSTVINSRKRLTYLEAQALIDGDLEEARKHAKTEANYTPELIDAVKQTEACAKAIRRRRRESGMIHLDLPDAELVFDDLGHVTDVVPEDDAFTHTIVEMFMVEANEVLARLFEGIEVPLLRRIHPEPTPGDVDNLRQAARVAGFAIPKTPTRMELQQLLDNTRGTGAARAVHMSVLRTLTRAEYSPALIGHFALASTAYAHFTSPIRRYADVTVHRALSEYLKRTDNGAKMPKSDGDRKKLGRSLLESGAIPDQDELVQIGRSCSRQEENSTAAERELRQFLVLQFLEEHMSEETLPAVITGVTRQGVFVQLDKYLADGMIKVEDLPTSKSKSPPKSGGDWRKAAAKVGRWAIDDRSGALVNSSTGRSFSIGDAVRVQIAGIDLALRRMDLVIADGSRDAGKRRKIEDGGGKSGGLNIEWDQGKSGASTGKQKRANRSRARDKNKKDHRPARKKKGR